MELVVSLLSSLDETWYELTCEPISDAKDYETHHCGSTYCSLKNFVVVHYTKPGMSCPVVRYAPIPAMIPIMASLPLSFSAIAFDCLSFIRKYLVLLVLLLRMHRLLLRNLALLPIR